MKKLVCLLLVLVWGTCAFAQTKNGTVYSEHEYINKTREMWKAFQDGDAAAFQSFFADSVFRSMNGTWDKVSSAVFKNATESWSKAYENLEVKDDKPAYPDAIDYGEGGTWVQDWLLFTGTHIESGINIAIPYHNLYKFNDNGKITHIGFYFPTATFDAIRKSGTTSENGEVYDNHPYITTVRKAVNAYCNKNLDELVAFYTENARFSDLTMPWNESFPLEDAKKGWMADFEKYDKITVKQQGYPDCIHYNNGDMTVVYSWWTWSAVDPATQKKLEVPVMMSDYFNKDGKITMQSLYMSTSNLE
ncbi:nuclear transport factor 2 family protein [Draconibacterium mangrovi]|uniref:nuclear transport factor 2 family protein n=1 Tax=Draconibacterium mangrovi TaxID=2697469 RepID=UPI0013D54685|nr:nuclear transport factor 2 family protein [Draconibacterium mangrovi]